MKKIIRWLANVSGVTRDIQIKAYKEIGGRMYNDAYWWNGGIMFPGPGKRDVWNAFFLYSVALKRGGYADINTIRSKVYALDKDEWIEPGSDYKIMEKVTD